MSIIKQIENNIVSINNQVVMIDSDVAALYEVETKRINEAVKNNPEKFPSGYVLELSEDDWSPLKSKFSTSTKGGKTKLQNNDEAKEPLLQKSGELIAEILDDDLSLSETETTIEINFAVLKFKHTIKRDKK